MLTAKQHVYYSGLVYDALTGRIPMGFEDDLVLRSVLEEVYRLGYKRGVEDVSSFRLSP